MTADNCQPIDMVNTLGPDDAIVPSHLNPNIISSAPLGRLGLNHWIRLIHRSLLCAKSRKQRLGRVVDGNDSMDDALEPHARIRPRPQIGHGRSVLALQTRSHSHRDMLEHATSIGPSRCQPAAPILALGMADRAGKKLGSLVGDRLNSMTSPFR